VITDKPLQNMLESCGFTVLKDGTIVGRETDVRMLRARVFAAGHSSGYKAACNRIADEALRIRNETPT
jgi:hypothetical protein